jgi:hypothetical protein
MIVPLNLITIIKFNTHKNCEVIFGELGNVRHFRFPENQRFSRILEMQSISMKNKRFKIRPKFFFMW